MELIILSLSAFWGFGFWSILSWAFACATIWLTIIGRIRAAVMVFGVAIVTAVALFTVAYWWWDTTEFGSASLKAIEGQALGWIALALIGAFTWLSVTEVLVLFVRHKNFLGVKGQ